jgi:TP901 family phage tail tape measure protein
MASPKVNVLLSLKDKFSAPLKDISRNTGIAVNDLRNANKGFTDFAKSIGSVALGIGKALGAGTLAIAGFATKVGMDFEAGMSKVQAISGATGEQLDKLTKRAKELGRTTSKSASEVAEGMSFMAMAGWNADVIDQTIGGLVRLSEAAGEEMGKVSDIVTDAMTAFKLDATKENIQMFGDVLASVSSNANTNISMMGETFKECSALAGTMGYSIQDMSLAIGLMANSGIKGSRAGTALKNAISNLASPTKDMQATMTQLGLSLTDSEGNMKSFRDIMVDLRGSMKNLSQDEQAAAASALFGKESMAGMLAIVNASEEDFNKLAGAVDNCNGAAENMAKTMQGNFKGQLKQFESVVEGIGISIYDKFKGPLTDAMKSINDALQGLNDSIENGDLSSAFESFGAGIAQVVNGIASTLPVVLPVIMELFGYIIGNADTIMALLAGIAAGFAAFQVIEVYTTLMTTFGAVTKGTTTIMGLFNAVMAANPISLTVIAIAALVAGMVLLYTKCETFRNIVNDVISFLISAFIPVFDQIKEAFNNIKPTLDELGNNLLWLWNTVLSPLVQFIGGVFVSVIVANFIMIGSIIGGVVSGIITVVGGIIEVLDGVINFITGVFTGNWQQAWDGIKQIFDGIWKAITGVFDGFIGGVLNGLDSIINKAKEALGFSSQANSSGETHNATGTSYFGGGSTYVNENNRGELINLPSGSQIIPHDLSKAMINNSNRSININLNIAGNVIGNDDFINQCGEAITNRLNIALANM